MPTWGLEDAKEIPIWGFNALHPLTVHMLPQNIARLLHINQFCDIEKPLILNPRTWTVLFPKYPKMFPQLNSVNTKNHNAKLNTFLCIKNNTFMYDYNSRSFHATEAGLCFVLATSFQLHKFGTSISKIISIPNWFSEFETAAVREVNYIWIVFEASTLPLYDSTASLISNVIFYKIITYAFNYFVSVLELYKYIFIYDSFIL